VEKIISFFVISFFKKTISAPKDILLADMHSHLLAGLDDGVKLNEEAVQIILKFQELGYQKLITTPHIMSDYYRNEPEQIKNALNQLNVILLEKGINIKVEAAAEYYLDEELIKNYQRI
jgi:protein-tyrosine phosphatase